MDFAMKFDHVREQVASDDHGKWDAVVPQQECVMHGGSLAFPKAYSGERDNLLAPTPWATTQICQRLGIPTAYFRKCPPKLQDAQFNYWVAQGQGSDGSPVPTDGTETETPSCWLLRARGDKLRGVLSDKYAHLDNTAVLESLATQLDARFQVGLFALTEESMHLRLVDPNLSREVLRNDRLMVGIHLSNSEVGKRAVTVDAMVFRLVCTNGLIRLVNGKSLLHQRHISLAHARFEAALAQAIADAMTTAAGFIEQLAWSTRQPVKDVETAITTLSKQWELSQQIQELVKFALVGESAGQQETLYGLVNALTNAAQRLSIDDRYHLEMLAGRLLENAASGSDPLSLGRLPVREA
jgi:hypothetical protein